MAKTKIGTHSRDYLALQRAFLWWTGYPEELPRQSFPTNLREMALECNRQRGSDLIYLEESYGYVFGYSNDAAAQSLWNIATKAGLAATNY